LLAAEPVIWTVALSKRYRSGASEVLVFEDVNLEINRGEKLALIGPSGAGKSTLLHLLGGLDRPSSGSVFFASRELNSMTDEELADFRNRHTGFVWQSHNLLPEFTALENVMMPLLIRGDSHHRAADKAARRLQEVGLHARQHHKAGELSGGEQQRVALARALAGDPDILFADEPTGSLDYETGERIADLLDQIHLSNGLTSVFVTHNVRFARRCDRILKLERGFLAPADSYLAGSVLDPEKDRGRL
jgi:lipoprotein-releasing system ATP-binding protein